MDGKCTHKIKKTLAPWKKGYDKPRQHIKKQRHVCIVKAMVFPVQFSSVQSLSRVRLCNPTDCSLPGSSVHGIFQARVLEWGALAFSSQTLPCIKITIRSDQIKSVAQSCPTLCDPMNCSTPGLPVHHQLPEFTQTHVYRVSDAIQTSHPLSSPSPPAPNPSQHQSLFQ